MMGDRDALKTTSSNISAFFKLILYGRIMDHWAIANLMNDPN
jgi:hypothetical protein